MTPLAHSEAHERLADLALEPAALSGLLRRMGRGADADVDPLVGHVLSCAICQAEVEEWQRLHATVMEALAGADGPWQLADLARDAPAGPPASLRASVAALATPRASTGEVARREEHAGQEHPDEGRIAERPPILSIAPRRSFGFRPALRLLPLVAVLTVVTVSGGLLVDKSRQLDQATADTVALANVTAALDRVIVDPGHRAVELRSGDGSVGGSVAWSSHDLVVLSTALAPPPAGTVYRCWIERDGERAPIGRMFFAGGTSYWTGSLDEWATTSLTAGSRFGISLEPASGSVGNPAILAGELGA